MNDLTRSSISYLPQDPLWYVCSCPSISCTSRSNLSSFSGLSCINSCCGDSAVPSGAAGWTQQLESTAVTSQVPCAWSLFGFNCWILCGFRTGVFRGRLIMGLNTWLIMQASGEMSRRQILPLLTRLSVFILDMEILELMYHLNWLPGESLHKAFPFESFESFSSVVQFHIQIRRHGGVTLMVFLLFKMKTCKGSKAERWS